MDKEEILENDAQPVNFISSRLNQPNLIMKKSQKTPSSSKRNKPNLKVMKKKQLQMICTPSMSLI
jgi:hypothetical protein